MTAIKKPRIFKQRDISRALKGATAAGLKVSRVEIDADGKLSLAFFNESQLDVAVTPFDSWKHKRNARSA